MTETKGQTAAELPREESIPEYDGYYSVLSSFVFHTCLFVALSVLGSMMAQADGRSSGVAISVVGDSFGSGPGGAGGGGGTDGQGAGGEVGVEPEMSSTSLAADVPQATTSIEQVNQPTEIDTTTTVDVSDEAVQKSTRQQIGEARRRASAAKTAVANALAGNLNQGSGGGGSKGSGGGSGGGVGGGTGSGAGSGRAGRAARWVLRFNNTNPRHYLAQLGGLKAEIAFPQRGDKYLFFSDLANTPKSTVRDLSDENRIYWVDENPISFVPVANELGVNSASVMVAFLPIDLEQKMLKMELAFKGATSEDEVISTIFECVNRGGGYDITVVDQRLRND